MYFLTFLLHRHGYEVIHARDGRQGIAAAEREDSDLILLDIQFSLMDGYAVARQIKTIQVLAGIPIVAVTSYTIVDDRGKTIAAGCSEYFEKPINSEIFLKQISEYLPGMIQERRKDLCTGV